MKRTLSVACTTSLLTLSLYAGDFPLADSIKDSQWAHINTPVKPADAWTVLTVWDGPTPDKITQPRPEEDESINPHDISITTIIKHFAPTKPLDDDLEVSDDRHDDYESKHAGSFPRPVPKSKPIALDSYGKPGQWVHVLLPVGPASTWIRLPVLHPIMQPSSKELQAKIHEYENALLKERRQDYNGPWITVSSHIKSSREKNISNTPSQELVQSTMESSTLPVEDPLDVYGIKKDNARQEHRNRCYHSSYHKSHIQAAYVAHILYKRSDINPPRNAQIAQASSASNPSKLLPSNRSPQETLKNQYVRGNNTTIIATEPSKPSQFIHPHIVVLNLIAHALK